MGIYAVISCSVSQRQLEIGIRTALGASPATVRGLVLRETLRLAVVGVALGIVGALVLTRLAASLLFGVTPTDPLTFGVVVAVLTAVAGLAGYFPAAPAGRDGAVAPLR